MSDTLETIVSAIGEKMNGTGFDGSAKFVIEGAGAVMLDGETVSAADNEADVTMSADVDTFRAIFDGDLDATAAFMSGKLAIDGDMGVAMQLASALA